MAPVSRIARQRPLLLLTALPEPPHGDTGTRCLRVLCRCDPSRAGAAASHTHSQRERRSVFARVANLVRVPELLCRPLCTAAAHLALPNALCGS